MGQERKVKEKEGERRREVWEPLDEQQACVCVFVRVCAYVHKPTVFSSLSISLRLPAVQMRRKAKEEGGE